MKKKKWRFFSEMKRNGRVNQEVSSRWPWGTESEGGQKPCTLQVDLDTQTATILIEFQCPMWLYSITTMGAEVNFRDKFMNKLQKTIRMTEEKYNKCYILWSQKKIKVFKRNLSLPFSLIFRTEHSSDQKDNVTSQTLLSTWLRRRRSPPRATWQEQC